MALSVAAAIAIFRFKTSVIATLLACAIAGMLWTLATG
jgi:chromate transporter